MTTLISPRGVRALSLVLVAWVANAGVASAATMTTANSPVTPISYQTVGTIDAPAIDSPGLLYYSGVSNGTYDGSGTIDLGNFVASTLARTTDATFNNTPFQIIASVGGDSSEAINGVINGQFGPSASPPMLTATITGISQYGNNPLPFALSLPLNTPLQLALPDSAVYPAPTGLAGAVVNAAPIPEPTSIAVFAVTLGGLGLWRRRRTAR